MTSGKYRRRAHHAGSWYDAEPNKLHEVLSSYLTSAREDTKLSDLLNSDGSFIRGTISPHAGFSYSGSTAAYAYLALGEAIRNVETVIVLHPSHHVHLDGCAISGASVIETPFCDLDVDENLRSDLLKTGEFTLMSQSTDETEHSGEMQYPFIAKVLLDNINFEKNKRLVKVLPIMVGSVSVRKEIFFGTLLAPFLARDNVFTIVSSDFCHWGRRFGYTPTTAPSETIKVPSSVNEIYKYIEWIDRLGMDEISSKEPGAFVSYLRMYKNTICGRHPITVYLSALKKNNEMGGGNVDIRFVKYAQSSKVKRDVDSSVSYASAIVIKI